jgi:hypothetical protein
LKKLGPDLADELVLVGGQAVNFWAARYEDRLPEVAHDKDLPTKDIDFCGRREVVTLCARRLGGRAFLPGPEDIITPNTGKVVFVDDEGVQQRVDFLAAPFGLEEAEVRRLAVPFDVEGPTGELAFHVMHPVHCLESRVANTITLPGYDSPHGLAQVRTMIGCAREYLREILGHPGRPVRDVLKLNERIYHLALDKWRGVPLAERHGLEVFDAVLADDERLPEKFRAVRYPQMRAAVERARRHAPAVGGTGPSAPRRLVEVVRDLAARGPVAFVSADWHEQAAVRILSPDELSRIALASNEQAYTLRSGSIHNLVTGRDEYLVVARDTGEHPALLREAVERHFSGVTSTSRAVSKSDPDIDGP